VPVHATPTRSEPEGTQRPVATLSYNELNRIDHLLEMQQPIPGAPDALFFVVAHQVTELWFKVILHELDGARRAMDADEPTEARRRLARVARGEDVLVCHLRAVGTITPGDFTVLRAQLGTSSAYESAQFREIEFLSGRKDPAFLDGPRLTATERVRLAARLREPSLAESFDALWERRGRPELAAVIAGGRDPELAALIEALLEHDEGFARWRHGHALMVERIIGYQTGTGGSSGVDYLRSTVDTRFFPRLWQARSALPAAQY
jgi:tryptophan 2,3-dioxygenase